MSFSKNELYILYSSDDNYAQHMGVSIYSLLNTNRNFLLIHIYIIDNAISKNSKTKIYQIIQKFSNVTLHYIPFEKWKNKLSLKMEWNISLSSYARLFVGTMLPNNIDRILYLDCDTIVCGSLRSLWKMELESKVLGAVQDCVANETKIAVGLNPTQKYFNVGVLLINLGLWRKMNIEYECINFIEQHKGKVRHHDQGVINGVLSENIFPISLKYNLMTIYYIFNRKKILKYYGESASFWKEEEIDIAKKNPIILHYTPSFTCRPWVKGCCHPLSYLYWKCLFNTPWKGVQPEKNHTKWYIRFIEWRYRTLPF